MLKQPRVIAGSIVLLTAHLQVAIRRRQRLLNDSKFEGVKKLS